MREALTLFTLAVIIIAAVTVATVLLTTTTAADMAAISTLESNYARLPI